MKLEDIAAEMRQACHNMLEDNNISFAINQRALERGLILALGLNATHWQLTLSRANVEPSEAEIDTCAGAFDIPEDTAAIRGVAYIATGKFICVARLKWPRSQPALLKE